MDTLQYLSYLQCGCETILQKTARHHIVGRWVFSKLPSNLGQQESSEHVKPSEFSCCFMYINQVWWVWVWVPFVVRVNYEFVKLFRSGGGTEVVGPSLQRLAYLWSFTAVAGTTLQERLLLLMLDVFLPAFHGNAIPGVEPCAGSEAARFGQ